MARGATGSTDSAGVTFPPPLIYLLPLLGGIGLHWWRAWPVLPSRVAAVLGPTLIALGMVGLPAVAAFRRAKTSVRPWQPSSALVTSGPFRFTRNPMYVGFTLIYLGVALWVNTAWSLLLLPIALTVMNQMVIPREEAYLERRFGDDYRAYRRRVRRWL
jgi:protein-S-isoprenylcysteine O-methyltransferase Ste14